MKDEFEKINKMHDDDAAVIIDPDIDGYLAEIKEQEDRIRRESFDEFLGKVRSFLRFGR